MTFFERAVLLAFLLAPGMALVLPAANHYFETRDCLAQFAKDVELAGFGLAPQPTLLRCDKRPT